MHDKVKITMLSAGLGLSGTPRVMMDIIENINHARFDVSVAYKPEYPSFEDDLLVPLRNMGIKLVPLRGRKLFALTGIIDLYKYLKDNFIQIVHCWDALSIIARILKPCTRCRIVESFGNPVTSKGSLIYYLTNKITSLSMDGFIYTIKEVQKSFEESGVLFLKGKENAVIANCINTDKIKTSYDTNAIKEQWHIPEDHIILTNVALFNGQKAQVYLLRAMRIILEKIPKAKLILVGWGPLENELKMIARNLGIENDVFFTGKREHEEVFRLLSITDIFVLSSLWEGFCLAIAEAMAMGKPVVSTRTDGSQTLIIDNETGFLVPQKDPSALANAITSLIDNPEKMRRMGEQARQRINTFFTPEKFIRSHEAFYYKILSRR